MSTWNIDSAHTAVTFAVKHMMVTAVRGSFTGISGSFDFDPANPANSSVAVEIDAASLNTGVADRDAHLRSADFFDVENHPVISFKSTKITVADDNSGTIAGDLTIRGITRPVTLEVEFLGEDTSPYGDARVGFEGTTKINREDWGLTWNVALESGGILVGKEVKLFIDVQGVKLAEPAAV